MFRRAYNTKSNILQWCKDNKIKVDDTAARQAVYANSDARTDEDIADSVYSLAVLGSLQANGADIYVIETDLQVWAEGEGGSDIPGMGGATHYTKYCAGDFSNWLNMLSNGITKKAILQNYCIIIDRPGKAMLFVCRLTDIQADKQALIKTQAKAEADLAAVKKEIEENKAIMKKCREKDQSLVEPYVDAYTRMQTCVSVLYDYKDVTDAPAKRFHWPWEN